MNLKRPLLCLFLVLQLMFLPLSASWAVYPKSASNQESGNAITNRAVGISLFSGITGFIVLDLWTSWRQWHRERKGQKNQGKRLSPKRTTLKTKQDNKTPGPKDDPKDGNPTPKQNEDGEPVEELACGGECRQLSIEITDTESYQLDQIRIYRIKSDGSRDNNVRYRYHSGETTDEQMVNNIKNNIFPGLPAIIMRTRDIIFGAVSAERPDDQENRQFRHLSSGCWNEACQCQPTQTLPLSPLGEHRLTHRARTTITPENMVNTLVVYPFEGYQPPGDFEPYEIEVEYTFTIQGRYRERLGQCVQRAR